MTWDVANGIRLRLPKVYVVYRDTILIVLPAHENRRLIETNDLLGLRI